MIFLKSAAIEELQEQVRELAKQEELQDIVADSLEGRIDALTNAISQLTSRIEDAEAKLVEYEDKALKQIELERKLAERDRDPWVDIKSARVSEERGLEVELDWNEKFIKYLAEAGIKHKDPEVAVRIWMASLAENIVNSLDPKDVKESFDEVDLS